MIVTNVIDVTVGADFTIFIVYDFSTGETTQQQGGDDERRSHQAERHP